MIKQEAGPLKELKPHRAGAHARCSGHKDELLAIRDVMQLLGGKWKIQIIGTLRFGGKMRFMDLMREVDGIAAKMLSKELQDLEMNKLVKRTVLDTKPITVEYEMTDYGSTLDGIICEIVSWGVEHRRRIMEK